MSALSRYYLNNFHDGVRQASCLSIIFIMKNHTFELKQPVLLMCFFEFTFVQDAVDLISGHYSVNRNNPSPFQLNGFESLSVSNTCVFTSYICCFFCCHLPSSNQFKLRLIEKNSHSDPCNCTSHSSQGDFGLQKLSLCTYDKNLIVGL